MPGIIPSSLRHKLSPVSLYVIPIPSKKTPEYYDTLNPEISRKTRHWRGLRHLLLQLFELRSQLLQPGIR